MADGTDDLEELEAELDAADDFQDEEASAAISEAQSVIDDAQSTGGGGLDLDEGASAGTDADAEAAESTDGGLVPSPSLSLPSLGSLWSTPVFVVAVLGAVAGAFGAGLLPLIDGVVAGGLGMLLAALVLGFATDGGHYLETGLAGTAVLGTLAFFGQVEVALAAGGSVLRLAAVGAGVGLVAAVIGTALGGYVRSRVLAALGGADDSAPGAGGY